MKLIIFSCLFAAALADTSYNYNAPPPSYSAPTVRDDSVEVVPILRDDRLHEDGHYSFDTETGDGIVRSEAGQPSGPDDSVVKAGSYSFTFPNGESFELKYVADENGFQPESAYLPVAPAFPHPIPDFVLEQIEKARIEDEEAARAAASAPRKSYGAPPPAPSNSYGTPQ